MQSNILRRRGCATGLRHQTPYRRAHSHLPVLVRPVSAPRSVPGARPDFEPS